MFKRNARNLTRLLLVLLVCGGVAATAVLIIVRRRAASLPPSWSHATLAQLQQASSKYPKDPQVSYYLGVRQQETQQLIPAMQSYFHAVELSPEFVDAWLAWSRLAAQILGIQQSYDVLKSYLSQHPESSQGHLMLALLIHGNGYENSAYKEAALAVKANPHNGQAWQLMGVIASGLQHNQDAVQNFRQALQCDPQNVTDRIGLGVALLNVGQPPEAMAELRQAVQIAPENGEAHLAYGRALLATAKTSVDYDAGRSQLQQAVDLKAMLPPQDLFNAYLGLGESYQSQQRWRDAQQWLENAVVLNPNSDTAVNDLAQVYRKLGDTAGYRLATQRYRKILAYHHEVETLTKRIADNRDDLQARLQLAREYKRHGDITAAIRTYSFLLLRSPGMEQARKELQALKDHATPGAH